MRSNNEKEKPSKFESKPVEQEKAGGDVISKDVESEELKED